MDKHKDLIEKIEKLSVLELHELVKALEEKFGVSAAAVAGPATAAGPVAEEKDSYTVVLASAGANKIAVMKIVKEVLALGLKEAKDHIDAHIAADPALRQKLQASSLSGARGCLFWFILLLFVGFGAWQMFTGR